MDAETSAESPRACKTCGKMAVLLVYALPGIPVSVGNCPECYNENAYPYGIAEGNTNFLLGGIDNAADWWKESKTYHDGRYLTMEEAFGD